MKHSILLKKFLQLPEWLLIIWLLMVNQVAFAQDVGYWDDRFSAVPYKWNSENIYWIEAIAVTDGGDIYASGLSLVGGIIKWNGKGWSPFAGRNGSIYAFATVDNDVYAGGDFTKIDSIQANRVAKYNRITQGWSALETEGFNGINHQPDGYNHRVYALAVDENNLYVGGSFTTAGAVNAKNIAQWDIATNTWTALGDGVNGTVYAIVVKDGEVYVGGGFSSAGGVPAKRIAKWNGREWSALGAGVNGAVRALTFCGDDLYVGGGFTKAGEANVRNIAKWNTVSQTWAPVGEGVWSASSVNSGSVSALASDGRVVYVGGKFGYADEMEVAYIVKWNPAKSCWSRLGQGLASPVGVSSMYTRVNCIQVRENDVYVGGSFGYAGDKPSNLFAIWHEPASPSPHAPAWSSVPDVTFQEDDSTQLELYQYVTDTEHDLRGGLNFSATVIDPPTVANSNDLQIRLQKLIMGPASRYVFATFTAAKEASGIYTVAFTVTDACGASASDTIQVTIKPVNGPPIFAALPELRFDEDKSLLHPIRNWYPFVADKDNPDSTLTFTILSGKNVKAARQAGNFRFSAPANWFGKDTLQLIVTDPGKLADTTALMVMVNPVNDAPKISGLPESLSFNKGASAQLNIWDFVEDIETPDSLLTYGFSASNPLLRLNFNRLSGTLTLTAPQFYGNAKLFVNISDGKASALDTINVTVIFVNDPPVISVVPELRFDEDKSLLYPIRNWYPFVTDKDHADSTLTFAVQAGKNVKAARQAGDFRFSALANWFGKDTLRLIVTDPGKLADTTALMITVNSVNDAPKISGLPDSLTFKKGGSTQLKLWDYVEDVETPDRQLTYTFSTSNPSLLRKFDYTTGVLILTAPQFHGRAQLFINVSDSKVSAQNTVAVRVELPTSVASTREPALPTAFQLWPNSPNPFNPGTTIRFDTPHAGRAKLAVYTLRGELVQTLVDGEMAAGSHQFHFDGRNLASGIYFYRMETDTYTMTRKMLLQK